MISGCWVILSHQHPILLTNEQARTLQEPRRFPSGEPARGQAGRSFAAPDQARAVEIAGELTQAFEFSPTEQLAVYEAARSMAILEAIDRDLDERGLVDKEGKPRYLLNHRSRTSRQLEQWLEKVSSAIEKQAASEKASARAEFPDYVHALQRIALGYDTTAAARDRLAALKELLELGAKGTTRFLERPAQSELTEREHAIREANQRQSVETRERDLGLAE